MERPFIIAISSVSGGGKTTITNNLCRQLNNAMALYFDEYDFPKQPDNICEWVENGSDSNAWDLSLLKEDITEAIANKKCDYLILDYPFGRQAYPIKEFIDLTIYINTPLDIALARRIIRDYNDSSTNDIINDLNFYIKKSRMCFTDQVEKMQSCDLIVDGSLNISEIVHIIKDNISQRT